LSIFMVKFSAGRGPMKPKNLVPRSGKTVGLGEVYALEGKQLTINSGQLRMVFLILLLR
jgi:hypothetical protein